MRVVGGRLRGRVLSAPHTQTVRPTSDRLREALFNILAHSYDGAPQDARVIDLFAGTGALGIEAVSRGARFALFVDDSTEGRALLRDNIESLGLAGITKIFRRDATRLGLMPPQAQFTLAFLDPPYARDLAGPALSSLIEGNWLASGALCVVEEQADADVAIPAVFQMIETRVYGDTKLLFLRFGT